VAKLRCSVTGTHSKSARPRGRALFLFDQSRPRAASAQQKGDNTVVLVQRNERAAQAAQTIASLADRFPAAFAVYAARRKPLKIGIFDDLLAATAGSIPADDLEFPLQRYTRSNEYLAACHAGAIRLDLEGNPAGVVTANEARWAAATAEEQHRRYQGAAVVPAQPQTTPPPAPAPTLKRLSLSDLKRAAQARRETTS